MVRATVLLVAASVLLATATDARAAQLCVVPNGAHVKARTKRAVAYTVDRPQSEFKRSRDFYGCLESVGRPVKLAHVSSDPDNDTNVGPVVLARSRLAYAFRALGHYGDASVEVRELDLRRPEAVSTAGNAEGYDDRPRVVRLLVTRRGEVAYTLRWTEIDAPSPEDRTRHREVRIRDAYGLRTVDDAPGVDLRSLARDGRTVTWLHDGDRRSAQLR